MRVYLPVEVYTRELLSKLLLSHYLIASNSVDEIFIGHNAKIKSLALRDNVNHNSLYFEIRGQAPSGMSYLNTLKNKGFFLVGQDEESGITFQRWNDFFSARPELNGISIFDIFFAWSGQEKDQLSAINSGVKIIESGSPRYSVWGQNGIRMFEKEAMEARATFGDYVVIITSFATANSLARRRSFLRHYLELGYKRNSYRAKLQKYLWQRSAMKVTLRLIQKIILESDLNVIIRPHPNENFDFWNSKFGNINRVHVNTDMIIQPLLIGASAILHTGSTLSLEAQSYCNKVFDYSAMIKKSDKQPKVSRIFSNSISSVEEMLEKLTSDTGKHSYQKFKSIFPMIGKLEPVEIQAKEIVDLIKRNNSHKKSISYADQKTMERNEIPSWKKFFIRLIAGKYEYAKIDSAKRPKLSSTNMNQFLSLVSKISNVQCDIQVRELEESVFVLKKNVK